MSFSPTIWHKLKSTRYHWGFLIGPKVERGDQVPGMRYHVKNHPVEGWKYEELPLPNVRSTNSLLARILIAKIENEERLVTIFRSIPVIQGDSSWRCRTWLGHAVAEIARDGKAVGSSAALDWPEIEAIARRYVGEKTAAGRYRNAADMLLPKPTFDMLERRETIS